MSQAPKLEEPEKPAHTELTVDLHDKKERLLNLVKITASMEKMSIEYLLKGSLNKADGFYLMTRLLRESLDKSLEVPMPHPGRFGFQRIRTSKVSRFLIFIKTLISAEGW